MHDEIEVLSAGSPSTALICPASMSATEAFKPQDDQPPDTHESNIEEPVVAQSLEETVAEQDTR